MDSAFFRSGFSWKALTAHTVSRSDFRNRVPFFNVTVSGLRESRGDAQSNEPLPFLGGLDRGAQRVLEIPHIGDVVIRRQDDHGRFRIAFGQEKGRQADAGGRIFPQGFDQ